LTNFIRSGVSKVDVIRCGNSRCHLFTTKKSDCFFSRRPSTNYLFSRRQHSHPLHFSTWSLVQCSCKFTLKIVTPSFGSPPGWCHYPVTPSAIASYGALGHVPTRLPTISFLVQFGVNLTAN